MDGIIHNNQAYIVDDTNGECMKCAFSRECYKGTVFGQRCHSFCAGWSGIYGLQDFPTGVTFKRVEVDKEKLIERFLTTKYLRDYKSLSADNTYRIEVERVANTVSDFLGFLEIYHTIL